MSRPVATVLFDFGGQNLTEAGIPAAARSLGIFVAQEVDRVTLLRSVPETWRIEVPEHDRHQAVCWDTDEWQSLGPVESHRIHGSGKGDPSVPDGIRTPARFVHVKRLRHRATGLIVRVIFTWWINSWKPAGRRDRWTAGRARLAARARKITIREMKKALAAGEEFLCEGDFNSLPARLRFAVVRGIRVVFGRGLERMYASRGLVPVKTWHLPKVGVGRDLRHQGLAARFRYTIKEKP
jgi:hypothetical protein